MLHPLCASVLSMCESPPLFESSYLPCSYLSPGCSVLLGMNHKITQIDVPGNLWFLTFLHPNLKTHQHLHPSFLLPLLAMKDSSASYQGQSLPMCSDPRSAYLLRELKPLHVCFLPSIFDLSISTRAFPSAFRHALIFQLILQILPLFMLFSLNNSFLQQIFIEPL